MMVLGFDVGGTNLRYAVRPGRQRPVLVPVPRKYQDAISKIAQVAREHRVQVIAGGLPGPLDGGKTRLLQSTNLPGWAGKNFRRDLARASRARVWLENDNALVALGEATHGAGVRDGIVAYIGLGTGIGGCRVVDGQIDANVHGFEPGHQIIDIRAKNRRHLSPHSGDWESLVSGNAIQSQTGRRSETISSPRFWREMERRTAIGLINVAMMWSPTMIVLGGSLMKKMSVFRIRQYFHDRMGVFRRPIPVNKAKLGDFGGIEGAFEYVKQRQAGR